MAHYEFVEIDGVIYARFLHHGYYRLKPVVDGQIADKGEIAEHRLVYEVANGTSLSDDICVHHLNRDKTDNRPENLIALSRGDHNKLHAFEDRNMDMKTLAKLDKSFRTYNENLGSKGAAEAARSKLVAHGDKIYHKTYGNGGLVYLSPVGNDGTVDYGVRIPEHKLVYELHHGVTLSNLAVITHINGIKDDNRPENLRLEKYQNGRHRNKQQESRCVDNGTQCQQNQELKECAQRQNMPPACRITKDELSGLIEKYSNRQIAQIYNVSGGTVAKWRKECGLPSSNEQHGWNRGAKSSFNSVEQEDIKPLL